MQQGAPSRPLPVLIRFTDPDHFLALFHEVHDLEFLKYGKSAQPLRCCLPKRLMPVQSASIHHKWATQQEHRRASPGAFCMSMCFAKPAFVERPASQIEKIECNPSRQLEEDAVLRVVSKWWIATFSVSPLAWRVTPRRR